MIRAIFQALPPQRRLDLFVQDDDMLSLGERIQVAEQVEYFDGLQPQFISGDQCRLLTAGRGGRHHRVSLLVLDDASQGFDRQKSLSAMFRISPAGFLFAVAPHQIVIAKP